MIPAIAKEWNRQKIKVMVSLHCFKMSFSVFKADLIIYEVK
jgi:hypothetical protein